MMEKLGHSYSKRKADSAHDIQWRRTVPFNYSHYFIAIGIHFSNKLFSADTALLAEHMYSFADCFT